MRQSFVCIYCGLTLTGRVSGGEIRVYGKSPTADEPPQPCICATCNEHKGEHVAPVAHTNRI